MLGEIEIKVIIRDGIVESILTDDTRIQIRVEIVDMDKDYRDYREVAEYADALYHNAHFSELLPTYASFLCEEEQ